VAAIRRVPNGTSGGSRQGAEPPSVHRYIVSQRVPVRPTNDNAPPHSGREALWFAAGIVLTLSAWLLVLRIIA
jgi:hypothetical protein